jgi:Tol biopolymer transport system component
MRSRHSNSNQDSRLIGRKQSHTGQRNIIGGRNGSICLLALLLFFTAGQANPVLAFKNVKLNGPLVSGGDVVSSGFYINGASGRVIYRADQDTDGVMELYSVPLAGGTPVKLNGPLVGGGNVGEGSCISPDGSRVVYRADQDTDEVYELYSVPMTGGTPVKLNGQLVSGGDVAGNYDSAEIPHIIQNFQISPDGSRVVYIADQDTDGIGGLYSVPITGGTPVKLNPPMVGNWIFGFEISPDSSRVVYSARQDSFTRYDLYSVPLTGGTAVKLNTPLAPGGDVRVFRVIGATGRVVYSADQDTAGVLELYSVPLTGGTPVKLNGPMVAGGGIYGFRASKDGSRVVYRADQEIDEVYELYSVPMTGSASPIKLNHPMPSGGLVSDFWISMDGTRVVYLTNEFTSLPSELYSVPLMGGTPVKLNGPLVNGGNVFDNVNMITYDSSRVIYLADQDTDGVIELYSAPLVGGAPPIKLNGPLTSGAYVERIFLISPDSSRVIYVAQQDTEWVMELYSVSSSGGTPVKLNGTLVNGGDVESWGGVQISPDGSRVIYLADQDTDEVWELYTDEHLPSVSDIVVHLDYVPTRWALREMVMEGYPGWCPQPFCRTGQALNDAGVLFVPSDPDVREGLFQVAGGPRDTRAFSESLKDFRKAVARIPLGPYFDKRMQQELISFIDRTIKPRGKSVPRTFLLSPVLIHALNAIELDRRLPTLRNRAAGYKIRKGGYVGADLGGLVWAGLRKVEKPGLLSVQIKGKYDAFPAESGYSPTWPFVTYLVDFRGTLGSEGFLDLTFDLGPFEFMEGISDIRVLRLDKDHMTDVTAGRDPGRRTVTGRTDRPGTFIIVGKD